MENELKLLCLSQGVNYTDLWEKVRQGMQDADFPTFTEKEFMVIHDALSIAAGD